MSSIRFPCNRYYNNNNNNDKTFLSLFSLSFSLSSSLGAVAVGLAHYGQGDGPIVLDNVACNGLETYITDCHNNGYYVHNCAHAEDAGVQCAGIVYQS